MATFRLSSGEIFDNVLDTLGARGCGDSKKTAIKDGIQFSLSALFTYRPWTWRRRCETVSFTSSSFHFEMPEDYESLANSEIMRTGSDGTVRTLTPRTDRDFWRQRQAGYTGQPQWYRIVPSSHTHNTNSSWWYVMEVAPYPDGDYDWPGVEYYCCAPELAFGASTGTVPNMPTEFFDTWQTGAEWRAARALGRHTLARSLKKDFDEALADAAKRHDITHQDPGPQGLQDPYGDVAAWA